MITFFAVVVGVAIIALGVIFFLNNQGGSSTGTGQAGQYPFQVGSPRPGESAPEIRLPATGGSTFDLAAMRGKTVLLYIDQVVSITTDPLNALQQKVADEGLTLPVLSDPSLAVSSAYTANGYGMMGASRDGHTFIVVGPDGLIKWRADYGGAPKYTMYVPVPNLIADIRAGLSGGSS